AEALEEGVVFHTDLGPARIETVAGKVSAIAFHPRIAGSGPTRKIEPRFDESQTTVLKVDTVIVAISQAIDSAGMGVSTGSSGRIAADKGTLATSVPGIFAGGDAVLGPSSIADAMGQGHIAAEAIDAYLRGGKPANAPAATAQAEPARNPKPGAPREDRVKMAQTDMATRRRVFTEINRGYTAEQAIAEAKRCLACGLCSECMECVKACSPGAICHDQRAQEREIDVGSVILTPGFEEFQASLRGEFGHGRYSNVLSSVQFERMLSAAGPTGGIVERPSDGGAVKRIAFIQCVGSRDVARGAGYCSSICCMSATKEAMVALEHAHGRKLEISIFCMDVRAFGKEFDSYVNRAREEHGVKFIRAIPSRVVEMPGNRTPRIRYFDQEGAEQQQDFDLVVLSVGLRPSAGVAGGGAQRVRFQPDGTPRSAGDIETWHLRGWGVPGTQGHSRIGGPGLRGRRLRHGPARALARNHGPPSRIPVGAGHHRRSAARRRVHLPLRPQHRFGRRRETGGR
ncbi:MAG: FAD-dependent oxidoreductase, partial [Bryobacteraceae bacterium]